MYGHEEAVDHPKNDQSIALESTHCPPSDMFICMLSSSLSRFPLWPCQPSDGQVESWLFLLSWVDVRISSLVELGRLELPVGVFAFCSYEDACKSLVIGCLI